MGHSLLLTVRIPIHRFFEVFHTNVVGFLDCGGVRVVVGDELRRHFFLLTVRGRVPMQIKATTILPEKLAKLCLELEQLNVLNLLQGSLLAVKTKMVG